MRIHTLWHESDAGSGDAPWLVDSVDEYTIEENGLPPEYAKKLKEPHHRELIIVVPDDAVRGLFTPPLVKAKVSTKGPVCTCHEHVSQPELSALCGHVSQCPRFPENFK